MIVYESLKMTQGKLCIKEENSQAKKKKKKKQKKNNEKKRKKKRKKKKKKKKMKHGRTIQFGLIQQAFFEAS